VIEVVVVGLHLRWHGVWQRPNHVLVRLANLAQVIVVEEEMLGTVDMLAVEQAGGITIVTPVRIRPKAGVDRSTIDEVRTLVAGRSALLWLYSPMLLTLSEAVPEAPIVYDKMDELSSFKGADASLVALDEELCERAAYVIAGGRSLWDTVKARVSAGGPYPSGVDLEAYRAIARNAVGSHGERSGRPVFGYIGVIDERIDLALLRDVSAMRPDASFQLAGPVAKIDPSLLPRADNIVYLGKVAYTALPALVANYTVALMPFAINEATRYISPTKTLEYLAAGLPVVSTAVPDVVADFGEIVYIASDAAEFASALRRAEMGDDVRRSAGRARAAAMTWDVVFASMLAGLATVNIVIDLPPVASGERATPLLVP
jgi:UDP-galactopyranose mutase